MDDSVFEQLSKNECVALIKKLQEEQNSYKCLIDNMSESIMVINTDHSVGIMDEKTKTKADKAELEDKTNPKCYEIYHNRKEPCEGKEFPCPLHTVIETKKSVSVLHQSLDENGKKHYLELVATPIYDVNENITGIIESTRDITTHLEHVEVLKEKSELLYFQANHDPLTNIPNRMLFVDRLTQSIAACKRTKTELALLFIDLDDFKTVNDTLGHEAGDRVLKEVSRRIGALVRESDTLCRFGGDEFTILLKGLRHRDEAVIFAQRVLQALKEPIQYKEHELSINCSIGISLYVQNIQASTLIKEADEAMYKAKLQGKNSFQFYEK